MDGGGSTTMALRNPSSGNISVVNRHSNFSLFGARHVGNNLGIYFVDEAGGVCISEAAQYQKAEPPIPAWPD